MEAGSEPVVYRAEVLAIIGALADLAVDVRAIRELYERGMAELRAREQAEQQRG